MLPAGVHRQETLAGQPESGRADHSCHARLGYRVRLVAADVTVEPRLRKDPHVKTHRLLSLSGVFAGKHERRCHALLVLFRVAAEQELPGDSESVLHPAVTFTERVTAERHQFSASFTEPVPQGIDFPGTATGDGEGHGRIRLERCFTTIYCCEPAAEHFKVEREFLSGQSLQEIREACTRITGHSRDFSSRKDRSVKLGCGPGIMREPQVGNNFLLIDCCRAAHCCLAHSVRPRTQNKRALPAHTRLKIAVYALFAKPLQRTGFPDVLTRQCQVPAPVRSKVIKANLTRVFLPSESGG